MIQKREDWVRMLKEIADPVLKNAAEGKLHARMPVEQRPGAGREAFTHLEAVGRLLCGMAPWLETPDPETGVNRWLETILAGLLQIRGEYGDDIARELAALSLRPCCLYPGEMGHAAQILQAGGGVEQIEGYLAASKLEDGPPFYPHMEDIAELYMPKRQMNDLNMGGM